MEVSRATYTVALQDVTTTHSNKIKKEDFKPFSC